MKESTTMLYHLKALLACSDIKAACAITSGFLFFAFGDLTAAVQALMILWFLDFLLGFLTAFFKKELSSQKMLNGLRIFVLYFVAISAGNLLDTIMLGESEIVIHGQQIGFRWAVVFYIGAHQALQVLQKLRGLGVPLPQSIYNVLREQKKRLDGVTIPPAPEPDKVGIPPSGM